ncbi:MAG: MFS transporter [Anaerobiospirillum succiniciproducens]|uniref:MFS transporter n=1 Tax=Anaerobiospirillum succiniciproducens TaxID=13335 RepID=UPI002A755527|nr:MFS transporter [Anaerobiospirillum succiniciproducens]MDY2798269.1 MFS transporter [Anaerobiospirillum succiniciproducens]
MTSDAQARKLIFSNRISFLAAGFSIAAWAPMIPYVKDRFSLDEHTLGLLLLCVGIGSFVAMPLNGYFTSKFGCRGPIYLAAIAAAACIVAIPFTYNLYVMAFILFVMGIAAITIDVVSNVNAALVEEVTERNIMSGLHGLYSVGGLLGSLSVTFLLSIKFDLTLVGCMAAVFILLLVVAGCKHLITNVHIGKSVEQAISCEQEAGSKLAQGEQNASRQRENCEQEQSHGQQSSTLKYYTHPIVLLIGIMCLIMFMTEASMLDWSGVFLHSQRGLALEHAGYGYAAFAVMMTICRLTGDKVVSKFGRGKVIIIGTMFIMAGFIVAVVIPHYSAAFLGFALIGVGASNVVPQLVSITARIKEVPTHISVTIVNTIGFTGILIGPALIGFLAHAITLPYTYLCQALSVLFVTVMSVILIKLSKDKAKD